MEEILHPTWDVKNLVNNGKNYLSTSAGFLPSTVSLGILSCCQRMIWVSNHSLSTVLVLRFHYHSQKVIGFVGYGLNSWDGKKPTVNQMGYLL